VVESGLVRELVDEAHVRQAFRRGAPPPHMTRPRATWDSPVRSRPGGRRGVESPLADRQTPTLDVRA
jgi:hypothetical protein